MMEEIGAPPDSRWKTWLLVAAVVLFVGSTGWNVLTRISTQSSNVSSLDAIIQAQKRVCLDNHDLARQYKIRGEAEKTLFNFFLALARKSIATGADSTGASRDFVEQFAPLASEIHILPLPDCHMQAARLRAELPPG